MSKATLGRRLAGFLLLPWLIGQAAAQTALPPMPAAPRQAPLLAAAAPVVPAPAPQPGLQLAQALQQLAQAGQPQVLSTGIALDQGSGRMVQLPRAAATVIAADPRIARVQPTSPTSLYVMGVEAGRTTVVATGEDGRPVAELTITVGGGRGLAPAAGGGGGGGHVAGVPGAVEAAIRAAVHGGTVRVAGANGGYILTGSVATAADAHRADAIARTYAGEDRPVVNEITVLSSIQVNLRVRVAEISRQLTREFGLNWSALAHGSNFALGYANIGSLISGISTAGRAVGAFRSSRWDLNALVDLLAADRLISILAEPNLTAQSGEVASFLAGGEFPIPVAATITGQVTVEFKQFGVSLAFVPTVLGPDRLNLRVRPEVSELTTNGAVSLPLGTTGSTVTIPALSVRRAETTVELGSGQSFAIAGLLQRNSNQYLQGVQGIDEVPVLGALFRSEQFQRQETELVIIVTPYIVSPVASPSMLAAPTDGFRPATDLDRLLYRRQVARGATAPRMHTPVNAGFMVE